MATFVEFRVDDASRFKRLCLVFEALKADKESGKFRDDSEYREMFQETELSRFWWPSQSEVAEWKRLWDATPYGKRFDDPRLKHPWMFDALLRAFENGEYALIACRMTGADRAVLEFDPDAFPYGGTGCMRALIEAFGFTIVGEDDGTGHVEG